MNDFFNLHWLALCLVCFLASLLSAYGAIHLDKANFKKVCAFVFTISMIAQSAVQVFWQGVLGLMCAHEMGEFSQIPVCRWRSWELMIFWVPVVAPLVFLVVVWYTKITKNKFPLAPEN